MVIDITCVKVDTSAGGEGLKTQFNSIKFKENLCVNWKYIFNYIMKFQNFIRFWRKIRKSQEKTLKDEFFVRKKSIYPTKPIQIKHIFMKKLNTLLNKLASILNTWFYFFLFKVVKKFLKQKILFNLNF